MRNLRIIVCAVFTVFVVSRDTEGASSLPHYIIPCARGPDFESCALKNAKYAIPFLIKGDRQYKIPSMNPLRLPSVDLQGNDRFRLKMTNLEIYGLDTTEVMSVKADFPNRMVTVITHVPRTTILADYEMAGKLVVFPIHGKGPCNITLVGGIYTFDLRWDLVDRNGEMYMKISDKSNYDYVLEKTEYHFENLFNGDKLLGVETNRFLNENWMAVNNDLKKPVVQTLLAIHNDIFGTLAASVPYNKFFL